MSPEQLKQLQKLSQLFEEGLAGPEQIKQLSDLLANINHNQYFSDYPSDLVRPSSHGVPANI